MGTIISDCELDFFQSTVEDQIRLSGENIDFYSLLEHSKDADPTTDYLYNEPAIDKISGNEKFRFKGPYRVFGVVHPGSKDFVATDRGSVVSRNDGIAQFAKKTFESENIPAPKPGDVIVWQQRYYDVILSDDKGKVGDTLSFTRYECTLKRTSVFLPERRADSIDIVAP